MRDYDSQRRSDECRYLKRNGRTPGEKMPEISGQISGISNSI
jgi:hypothetical protein